MFFYHFFYQRIFIAELEISGNKSIKNHLINIIIRSNTIGVKSKGQIFVGIIFLIQEYIGNIKSSINFILITSQNKDNQDNIIWKIIT